MTVCGFMTSDPSNRSAFPPHGSMAGFKLGLRLALPVIPGMVAFGLAVGATAARKGFGFIDHMLMNVFVYAGMSQLVAMEAWPNRITVVTHAGLAGPPRARAIGHAGRHRGRLPPRLMGAN
jgi:hypothetical protein